MGFGHEHTRGIPNASIGLQQLADEALANSAAGRAKMADGFLSADAAGRAKMADGFLSADAAGRAKMADGFVVLAKIAADAVNGAKIRLDNNQALRGRNVADTADIDMIVLDGSNLVKISPGGAVTLLGGGLRLDNNKDLFARNQAGDGTIDLIRADTGDLVLIDPGGLGARFGGTARLANDVALLGRNAAGTDDIEIVKLGSSDTVEFAKRLDLVEGILLGAGGDLRPPGGSTGMITGFVYIPTAAGPPTGTPSEASTSRSPLYFDNTNKEIFVYDQTGGSWLSTGALT